MHPQTIISSTIVLEVNAEQTVIDRNSFQCRNKLLAKAFKEAGLIERYGSGIQRILNICKVYGIVPPVFEEIFNGFKVTLFKEKVNVGKELSGSIAEVFKLVQVNPKLTIKEIAEITRYTRRTIERSLSRLKELNIVKRSGGRKEGKWVIAKPEQYINPHDKQ